MFRLPLLFVVVAALCACGPKPRPIPDAGEEDAGIDAGVDAGRPRGDDPPNGWSVVAELPAGAMASTQLGPSVSSAGDQYGQPLVAGVHDDPNGDMTRLDTRVFFTRWNGETKKFDDLKTIEIVGEIDLAFPARQVSIARDPDTGQIGIAYVKSDNSIRLAYSDDEGANFSLITASPTPPTAALVSNPSLAMKGGTIHVAYVQGSDLRYRKRVGTGSFVEETPPGSLGFVNGPVSLALDSAGNVGIAALKANGPMEAEAVFWRPGGAVTTIATSNGVDVSLPERKPSITLTFVGDKPHVAYHLRRDAPAPMNDNTPELFYAKASDAAGTTWSTPLAMPRNGNGVTYHSTRWYQAVQVDTTGRVSVAGNFAAQGALTMCGGPKLARSDDGVTFTTCAPANSPAQFAGESLTMWPHKLNKQTLIFHYPSRSNANLKAGVVMWREP